MTTAKEIYQRNLDLVDKAFITGNWRAFRANVHVPQYFRSYDAEYYIETEVALRKMFGGFCDHAKATGMATFARFCVAARFIQPDLIEGIERGTVVRSQIFLDEPYDARCLLRLIDGTWRVISSENAIDRPDAMVQAVSNAGHPDPNRTALPTTELNGAKENAFDRFYARTRR